jgi:hypothetical protein
LRYHLLVHWFAVAHPRFHSEPGLGKAISSVQIIGLALTAADHFHRSAKENLSVALLSWTIRLAASLIIIHPKIIFVKHRSIVVNNVTKWMRGKSCMPARPGPRTIQEVANGGAVQDE